MGLSRWIVGVGFRGECLGFEVCVGERRCGRVVLACLMRTALEVGVELGYLG